MSRPNDASTRAIPQPTAPQPTVIAISFARRVCRESCFFTGSPASSLNKRDGKENRAAHPLHLTRRPWFQISGGIALVIGISKTVGPFRFHASTAAARIASTVSTRAAVQP